MHPRALLRSLALAVALSATAVALVTPAAPAGADSSRRTAARAEPVCTTGVLGQDRHHRLVQHVVRNGRVAGTRRSRPLPFAVTALGYVDVAGGVSRLAAATPGGTPRLVRMTEPRSRATLAVSSRRFAQRGFAPALFTDAYGFYAYTLTRAGVLHRWELTRDADDALRYTHRVRVTGGLRGIRALTTAGYRAGASPADLLYAVTARGALRLLTVPHARPGRMLARTLLRRGYAGVTELSSGYCTGADRGVVAALDPVAGRATWTIVSDLTGRRASAHHRGQVRGRADWRLHGVI